MATKVPKAHLLTQLLGSSIYVSHTMKLLFSRDISQDYIESETDLERDLLIWAPQQLNVSADTVLKVVKPLYEIHESGLHW